MAALTRAALRVAVALALAVACARAASRPDIVVLLTDQQRADALAAVGAAGLRTPALDRLAREGALFTRAFCATPQCSPSRAALLTGRYPHRTGVMGNVDENASGQPAAGMSAALDRSMATLGRIFAGAGYQTAYFGKWHLGGNPGDYGFEAHDSGRPEDAGLVSRIRTFLRSRSGADRKPMLLMASWLNPHEIYGVARAERNTAEEARVALPESLADDLRAKPFPQRHYLEEDQGKPFRNYTPEDWRRYAVFYNRLVEKVDQDLGEIVEEVRKTSPGALVLISSDHGDLGGAHRLPFKGPAMYEELVRIPMILSWPGKVPAGRCDALVSNIDVFPTLCEAAEIKPPEGIDGRSILPVLAQKEPGRDVVFGEYYGKQSWRVPIRMARTRTLKYVRYQHYGEELYDLIADPREMRNLAGAPEHKRTLERMSALLDRFIAWTEDPFPRLAPTDRAGRPIPPSQ
jgi:arylsulfatase A-like enzyme